MVLKKYPYPLITFIMTHVQVRSQTGLGKTLKSLCCSGWWYIYFVLFLAASIKENNRCWVLFHSSETTAFIKSSCSRHGNFFMSYLPNQGGWDQMEGKKWRQSTCKLAFGFIRVKWPGTGISYLTQPSHLHLVVLLQRSLFSEVPAAISIWAAVKERIAVFSFCFFPWWGRWARVVWHTHRGGSPMNASVCCWR